MISRSLGPEAGAMIGIIFALTNAAFVGLNLIGAAEAVVLVFDVITFTLCHNVLAQFNLIVFLSLFSILILDLRPCLTQSMMFVLLALFF
jgi:hypothetical protein